MAEWDVPGCAIAIVEQDADGEWQSAVQAFGVRDEGLPMTTQTRVLMASNTKLFTAVAIDMLIRRSDGHVTYTTPVRDVISGFELFDPIASQCCTIEDLLCHRSGMARYNELLRYESSSEIIYIDKYYMKSWLIRKPEAIKHFRPAGDFREKYIYNNWMYDLLGLIVERLAGMDFKTFVTKEILQPLGLTQSTLHLSEAEGSGDIAAGYWCTGETDECKGRNVRVESGMNQGQGLAPSAGLWSTAEDMAKWLKFLLTNGTTSPNIASREFFKDSIRGRTIVDVFAEAPELSPRLYGLARRIGSYQGVEYVEHGGSVTGIMTQVCVVPGADWGIALLVNSGPWGDLAYNIIKWRAFEEKFGVRQVDWNKRYWERRAKEVQAELASFILPAVSLTDYSPCPFDPSSISGTYRMGPITISVDYITRAEFPTLGQTPFFSKKWGQSSFVATHRTGTEYDGALKVVVPGRDEAVHGKRLDIKVLEGGRIRVKGLMGLESSYTGFEKEGRESDIVFDRVA